MFLDTFMDDASEGIMENPVPDLDDLQLECAVSLEAAYNDFMLEGCQLEFQAFCEGRVESLNEGIVSSIINFFKKIWRMICKVFGFSDSGSGGGGGGSHEDISRCRARMRKLMARPESEIRKRLESWKQIQTYNLNLFISKLWHVDDSFIEGFADIMHELCGGKDDEDRSYDHTDTEFVLQKLFEKLNSQNSGINLTNPSAATICSAYSNYVKSIQPKHVTTLYNVVAYSGVDLLSRPLGTDIEASEIDIRRAMTELEKDLEYLETSISAYNESMWRKLMDELTRMANDYAKTKPKTSAFICQMVKDFTQIAIYIGNINRSLYAGFLNTLYRALR